MRILICTGIYPPKTSGPAQYAFNMNKLWSEMGHKVVVKTYKLENKLPTGIRHIYFFIKILPAMFVSDFVFSLDTYSVGFPSVLAAKILNKKIIIRTGGDFLWEKYVERTGEMVLLKDFYKKSMGKFTAQEKVIFGITKWTLKNVKLLVFSTDWQRQIFAGPYGFDLKKTMVVENHYDPVREAEDVTDKVFEKKVFVSGTRPLRWKNIESLKEIFSTEDVKNKHAILDNTLAPHKEFMEKIKNSYAVILVSLGDISPHMILDAISLCKPFIVTKENGLLNRISDIAILVDPLNKSEIKEKILWLSDEKNYISQVNKIKNFSFVRTWDDIAREYIDIYNSRLK